MKKKSLSLILSLLLVFTVFSLSTEAAEIIDMPENWSTEALEKAVSAGFLKGHGGRIRPGDSLTRAEMATVINRVFEAEEEASLEGYIDVKPSDWFYSDMAKAVELGSFKGDGQRLEPNKSISRQEAFLVIARALDLETSNEKPEGLTDLQELAPWARDGVYALVNAGYVKGSDGRLNPQGEITRAEFAQLLDNITFISGSQQVETVVESYNLKASADKIDLNSSTDHDKIEFTLEKLENGKNYKDVDLGAKGYGLEVFDADGQVLFKKGLKVDEKNFTISRGALINERFDIEVSSELKVEDREVTSPETIAENSETGQGLVKIYDKAGKLLVSKNFNIIDTGSKIESVRLAEDIDLRKAEDIEEMISSGRTNSDLELDLSQIILELETSHEDHDGILSYHILGTDMGAQNLAIYYSSGIRASTDEQSWDCWDCYSYKDGDILLGIVNITTIGGNGQGNIIFPLGTLTNSAEDVKIASFGNLRNSDYKAEFEVKTRGNKTLAKEIYEHIKER